MKANDLIPIEKNMLGDDYVLMILIACLLLLCALKYLFTKNYKNLINKTEYLSFVDDNSVSFSLIVNGTMVLLTSLLIVSHFDVSYNYSAYFNNFKFYNNFRFDHLLNVSITFILISGIMLVRLFVEITFYQVFYESSTPSHFMRSSSFINAKNVLLLLIVCLLFFYTRIDKNYLLLACFGLLFISRIYEIYITYSKQVSNIKSIWYYNILYLCTLEILPIMVLAKVLTIDKVI